MSEMYPIKPLAWKNVEGHSGWWASPTDYDEYEVFQLGGDEWYWGTGGPIESPGFPSADAAKLAAEAHWQARIKQALVAVEVKQHDGSGQ